MITKHQGFSLIEVMIAFVLIGISSLGLVKLQTMVESQAEEAKNRLGALYLMETKFEGFRQRGVSSASHSYSFHDVHNECNAMVEKSATSAIQLTCESELLLTDTVSSIILKAYWLDRFNQKKQLELITMISKYSEFD
ncbi:type IV pilus modification PilV family protein [Vibrio genomosp. F10]|nr:prepilin-type N-terminal cleavage/methylation domain-containing protein [Vibrio genomosp. F10]OEE93581.1 prepilin-type N-terminal cleavage/methylation domain-containing protein [Vibrio genomosp. F10 str. 9ZC157]OEF04915.1 prepilin-type N-terminal cleavage/methylation domain-containing protein [Vibrio genomosp. F10 str. 9ZB36]OEF08757.1 prepilin-type N-terminal cleavage/methylation domain-containing protein [Vibrio genomosp. F10 str. 9ZD137]